MMVAGLLSQEQLANVFLNVEELIQVNAKFTEALKDAIEIALENRNFGLIKSLCYCT